MRIVHLPETEVQKVVLKKLVKIHIKQMGYIYGGFQAVGNHCATSAFHQVRCGIHQRTKAYFPPLDGPRNESTEYTMYVFMLTEVLMFVA